MGSLFRGLFSFLSFGVMIAMVLKMFFIDVVKVPHNGMAPTLLADEYVAVWRNANVDMADIVICQHPANREAHVLGRAVAFAGQTIRGERGDQVIIDERHVTITGGPEASFYDVVRDKLFTMRVNTIEYRTMDKHTFMILANTDFSMRNYQVTSGVFLLGDNRSDPNDDSREFGEVDPSTCTGQVFMRLFPAPAHGGEIHHSYLDVLL